MANDRVDGRPFSFNLPPSCIKSISFSTYSSGMNRQDSTKRRGGAKILFLFVMHQYIGPANHLAPIYWCCKQKKYNKEKVWRTVSPTSPIRLNVALPIFIGLE